MKLTLNKSWTVAIEVDIDLANKQVSVCTYLFGKGSSILLLRIMHHNGEAIIGLFGLGYLVL